MRRINKLRKGERGVTAAAAAGALGVEEDNASGDKKISFLMLNRLEYREILCLAPENKIKSNQDWKDKTANNSNIE